MPNEYRFLVDGRIPVLKVHHEPRPARTVIVLHGLGASAEQQRKELSSLADHGVTAIGVDAPHHGARRDRWLDEMGAMRHPQSHERFLHLLLEATPEISRVIDHLQREGHGPIGLAGISMGAYTALAVAAQDARVRATVSILGSPDWTPREEPITEEIRKLLPHAPVHRPTEVARNPLLLFNASRDVAVPARFARDFSRMLQERHPGLASHVAYFEYPDSEHIMSPKDWEDLWRRTLGFFQRHLG